VIAAENADRFEPMARAAMIGVPAGIVGTTLESRRIAMEGDAMVCAKPLTLACGRPDSAEPLATGDAPCENRSSRRT
jgi:hypothetical protein